MFSEAVEHALDTAVAAHRGQVRKGPVPRPYHVHPLQVALLLARLGADDVVLQAALLHDVVEDCEGWTLERVEGEFGAEVAGIVAELTEDKSRPWSERKQWAVDHAGRMSERAAEVKAADQLHNILSLCNDLERTDDHASIWSRFKGGCEATVHMKRRLVDALAPRLDERLARGLEDAMEKLERLAAGAG
jgi:GTP diphosphokinase / guanosine-3',5'-bis(diphosphate) 3'-diphosphatase